MFRRIGCTLAVLLAAGALILMLSESRGELHLLPGAGVRGEARGLRSGSDALSLESAGGVRLEGWWIHGAGRNGPALLSRQRREHQSPAGALEAPGRVSRPRRFSRGLPRLREEHRDPARRPLRRRRGDLPGGGRARVPGRSDRALWRVSRLRGRGRDGPAASLPGRDPGDARSCRSPRWRRRSTPSCRGLSFARASTTRRRSPGVTHAQADRGRRTR